jgi:hypothetical protein
MLAEDEDGTYSDDYDFRFGLHLGLDVISPLNESVDFKSGAYLTTKGFKIDDSIEDLSVSAKVNLLYLDIPLTFAVNMPTESGSVYGAFGPYLGIGLTGSVESTFEGFGESESEDYDIEWGSDEDEDDFRRLDYGLMLAAGINFGDFGVEAAYSYGLANISAYREFDNRASNRLLTISLIYNIQK